MSFRPPPVTACWQHCGARSGFEVAYFVAREHGWRIDGTTAAIEDAQTWVVTYRIELDAAWVTRSARIKARTATGRRETLLESDGAAAGSSTVARRLTSTAAWMWTWSPRP